MNIKSEIFSKPSKWFPNFSFTMVLFSIVISIFLSLLIIGFGQGIFLKLLAILIAMIVLLVWTYDTSVTSEKDRPKVLKQGLTMVIMSLIIIETPLYFNSFRTTTTDISVITTEQFRDGARIEDNDGDSTNDKYEQVSYKLLSFYDKNTNEKIGYRKIEKGEEENIKLYDDIVGKEFYVNYFPFFTYETTFRYIREGKENLD